MMAHKQTMLAAVISMMRSPALLLLLGVITVTGGLAVILGHNVWSGGAATVIVTLAGWIMLLKGSLFLFLRPETESSVFIGSSRFEQLFYFYAAIAMVFGIYLTYAGFSQRRSP